MGSRLDALFDHVAFTAEAVAREAGDALYPEERACIESAVAVRRAEFGTARVCVRRGLAAMGIAPAPIVPRKDGPPTWPAGVVGSISHTHGHCAVALGRSPPLRSVGLDVETLREPGRPLDAGVEDTILTAREKAWVTAREKAWVTARGDGDRPRSDLVLLFFSAKEAYYKCQYPVTRTFLDFVDVEVEVLMAEGRFIARLQKRGLPTLVSRLEGKFAFDEGRVACGVELLEPV